jgi:thiol-disulfide isomerase/thioredoxin
MSRFIVAIVLIVVLNPAGAWGDESSKSGSEPEYATKFRALQKTTKEKVAAVYSELEKEFDAAKTEADIEKVSVKARERSLKIVSPAVMEALELVRPHAADLAAVKPLIWIAGDRRVPDAASDAVELLRKHHLTRAETIEFARLSRGDTSGWVEPLLRAQVASADLAKDQRPRVLLILAIHLQTLATEPSRLEDAPGLEDEAVKILEELTEKHADAEIVPGVKIGEVAKSSIFEIKNLGIGKVIPDIKAEDLDGVTFKLSDYRGKVVMLSFWASWCGPCMALVPHERELVEQYKDKPFVLIGVNGDPDKKELKKVLEQHKITWRSFWCGEDGPEGELPKTWNVNGWPMVYLIDHKGVIQAKGHSGRELERKIEKLIAKAEKEIPPKK